MAEVSGFNLDHEAESLFHEFNGIEVNQPIAVEDCPDPLPESAFDRENQLDAVRIYLVELVHLLGSYFKDVRYWAGGKAEKELLGQIKTIFDALRQGESPDDTIIIRHRGYQTGSGDSAKSDYVMYFGNTMVDLTTIIPAVMKRQGIGASHLGGKLVKAFEIFTTYGINNLFLKIPDNTPTALETWWVTLRILSRFNPALKEDAVIAFEKDGKSILLPIVHNEMNQPDPNLTLVTGLNGLKPDAIQSLIKKVDARIQQINASSSKTHFIGVYNALFAFRSLREKLVRPPVEVNNLKWLIMDHGQEVITKEKAQVAAYITENFGNSPLDTSQIINSVYGNDFDKIDPNDFGQRLNHVSELLSSLEKDINDRGLKGEVVENIKARMEQVGDDVYDTIVVEEEKIAIHTRDTVTVVDRTHGKLIALMNFFKKRSKVRRKMRDLAHKGIDFEAEDYKTLAGIFGISVPDAKHLISLLKQCFDKRGYFIRSVFEKHMPAFLKFEEQVFEFLWYYLKQTPDRVSRVAFLNSLQLLIARMKQQESAIQVLLTDLCDKPHAVEFSDRNALMLSNLLVRKYNKEVNVDIEITPEEVLLIQDGLNREVVQKTASLIDNGHIDFYEKVKTIHQEILTNLSCKGKQEADLPLRYLVSLEREAFIFLALVGGSTGRTLIRRGVEEYGRTETAFYQIRQTRQHLPTLLQQMRVLIRSLGRIGERNDLLLLEEIKSNEEMFRALGKTPEQIDQVRRIIEWAERARESIIQNDLSG